MAGDGEAQMPDRAIDGLPLHVVWPLARPMSPKAAALPDQFKAGLKIR